MTTFLGFTTGLFLGWVVKGIYDDRIKEDRLFRERLENRHDWVDDIVVDDKK